MNEKSKDMDEKSLRKAHFEKAQSKINRKLRVKNLCCNIFVVFLKCTLENGLGGFEHKIVIQATSTRIKLQVQEFKLQAQEIQVSSTSFKFQDQH